MENATLKNLRDFLLQYNKISESCFLHCVNHLSDRDLSQDEGGCVDMCTKKHVSVNHKVMQVYMEIQPQIINKKIEDANRQQQLAMEEARKQQEKLNETDSEKNNSGNKVSGVKKLVNVQPGSETSEIQIVANTGS
ncbi:hypothetical protein RUM43_007942 [Polyplax serrata]|uniref:Mitochondrial import inner membrane translocase subunit n=1 Tax=Polyplax serrata TaxID=468196 RepID=A0AAN8P2J9_POLSC